MADPAFFAKGQIVVITVTLGVALILNWFIAFSFSRLEKHLHKSTLVWRFAIIRGLGKPLIALIWVIALSLVIPVVVRSFGITTGLNVYLNPLRAVATILAIFWAIMRFIAAVEGRYVEQICCGHVERDRTSIRAISLMIRCVAVIVVILMLLNTFGIKITSLLAVGGLGGIALAFAAKDTIANFLGGMMIFWDRPFSVGDWISSPDKEIEGTVQDIGWRLTRILTFDKRPLYVPNGVFSTIGVENPSRMTNRRIKTKIGLRYCDAHRVAGVIKDTEEMLRNHPEIDTSQTLIVNLVEFGDSSLNFLVYTFTKTTDWIKFQAVQQDVFLKIIEIITKHGAECAFPSRSLYSGYPLEIQPLTGASV